MKNKNISLPVASAVIILTVLCSGVVIFLKSNEIKLQSDSSQGLQLQKATSTVLGDKGAAAPKSPVATKAANTSSPTPELYDFWAKVLDPINDATSTSETGKRYLVKVMDGHLAPGKGTSENVIINYQTAARKFSGVPYHFYTQYDSKNNWYTILHFDNQSPDF